MRRLIVMVAVAAVLVGVFSAGVTAQAAYQRLGNVWARSLRSTSTLITGGEASVGGGLDVAGNATIAGNATVTGSVGIGGDFTTDSDLYGTAFIGTGDVELGGFVVYDPVNTKTIVADGTLTTNGTNQPISSASAVGTSSIVPAGNGSLVHLINVGSNTITFTDTGALKLAGNAALGAADTLTIISDGTDWYEIARSNN